MGERGRIVSNIMPLNPKSPLRKLAYSSLLSPLLV